MVGDKECPYTVHTYQHAEAQNAGRQAGRLTNRLADRQDRQGKRSTPVQRQRCHTLQD